MTPLQPESRQNELANCDCGSLVDSHLGRSCTYIGFTEVNHTDVFRARLKHIKCKRSLVYDGIIETFFNEENNRK